MSRKTIAADIPTFADPSADDDEICPDCCEPIGDVGFGGCHCIFKGNAPMGDWNRHQKWATYRVSQPSKWTKRPIN